MKHLVYKVAVITSVLFLVSCNDFFDTNPDTIINEDDYISTNDEMYRGFLGILTKMQEAGDHPIFLTDTRGDFLEITENAPIELQNLYKYEKTDKNSYADPTCYYAIIIACNDFFDKMTTYKKEVGDKMSEANETNFDCLVSSAIRLKVWAYLTLGRIYGKAVWFDDPLEELKDLHNDEVFTWYNSMESLVNKCIEYLDNGMVIEGKTITSDLDMNWVSWIDEENENWDAYGYWSYLIPPYLLLRSDLLSWRCSYTNNLADWQWIRDNILDYIYTQHTDAESRLTVPDYLYACNIPLTVDYYSTFYSEQVGNEYQLVCGIMYDYDNHQRNRLVQYFCPTYPGDGYYLKPSDFAVGKYIEADIRGLTQRLNMNTLDGKVCLSKYFYFERNQAYLRTNIFEIEPTIILYRGHDYHFLLAEAENHLGNWRQANCVLNMGIENEFPTRNPADLPADWHTGYASWFGTAGGYGDVGIVGCVRGQEHNLPLPTDADYALSEEERIKMYDMAMLDEYLLEFTGEGKSYSYMIKMAERYGKDASVVSDRVVPKYPAALQDKVRASIASSYWIDWDLDVE